ncbi:thiamine diphosphokinase [Aquibacillus rhizosphaerae]|uniref:Thiamine diphosphokinase n=1 Tax=Aquibacillus rhizosphaerae TaxID=3051431 RepID=A0ABT7L2C8_9BACI|nr:thiamine diphosphokinase [Aquibacillus sp. LR5S19]MDL4840018.1 thiamine diphosphokinase [Aquibacillus sp. LR5S19]
MTTIAIVAGGPAKQIPNFGCFKDKIDKWIGADRGALTIIKEGITPTLAIGDFDSLNEKELKIVKNHAEEIEIFPIEKNETDLELAIFKAIEQQPTDLYLFGVTGGRLDHGMASIQLLYRLKEKEINGIIVDENNLMELRFPGTYNVYQDSYYPNISFLPFSNQVIGISLHGFYYKLVNKNIFWGSTLCISNKLLLEKGTFSFREGILLVIKSRDVLI